MALIPSLRWRPVAIPFCFSSVIVLVGGGSLRPSELARPLSTVPDGLRPVILQTLNQDAGPEFTIAAVERSSSQPEATPNRVFQAVNARHDFDVEFSAEAVTITSAAGAPAPLRLTLDQYGRRDHLVSAAMRGWESRGTRIERSSLDDAVAITEWYVNGPLGLEQGFTIHEAPPGAGALTLHLAVEEPWSARAAGRSVEFVEKRSQTVLTYGELYAFDADGRTLAAALMPTASGVAIRVDAEGAPYPITIDPFIQQQTLNVAGLAAGDEFGFSVAITADGSTAVVGAPGRDIPLANVTTFENSGSAYVFVRTGQSWQMQAQLSSGGILSQVSTGGAEGGRRYGHAVAVSGDTAVVTAPFEDVDGVADAGVAYAFRQSGSTWSLVQTLTSTEPSSPHFGLRVAMDVRATALMAIMSNGPIQGADRLHIYTRPGGNWTHAKSTSFGNIDALAVSGNTIVVGDPRFEDATVVMSDPATPVPFSSIVARSISAPDGRSSDLFGSSVAIAGDLLLVGAPGHGNNRGAGYVFRGSGTNWTFEQKLIADNPTGVGVAIGSSAAVSGNETLGRAAILGAIPTAGQDGAYVFRRGPTRWVQTQTLSNVGRPNLAIGVDSQTTQPVLLVGVVSGSAIVFTDLDAPSEPPAQSPTPGGLVPPTLASPVVTGSTVRLNWTASPQLGTSTGPSALTYHLRAGTAPGASNAFDGNVGATTSLVATSVPNGSYFVRVHSVGASGESGPSNEVRVDVGPTNSCTPPIGPTNLRATVNGALVTLTWNAAPGAVTYVIEAGSAAGLANLATLDVGVGTTFMASAPPGTYFVRVRMHNACGGTATSNEIVVQVS